MHPAPSSLWSYPTEEGARSMLTPMATASKRRASTSVAKLPRLQRIGSDSLRQNRNLRKADALFFACLVKSDGSEERLFNSLQSRYRRNGSLAAATIASRLASCKASSACLMKTPGKNAAMGRLEGSARDGRPRATRARPVRNPFGRPSRLGSFGRKVLPLDAQDPHRLGQWTACSNRSHRLNAGEEERLLHSKRQPAGPLLRFLAP